MHGVKLAAAIAAISAGLSMTAAAASTDDATQSTCLHLDSQVRAALDANENAANYDGARKEFYNGRNLCDNGMYALGTKHYGNALALLGGTPQTPKPSN